jgi:dihydroorotase
MAKANGKKLIRGGRVIDALRNIDDMLDVLVEGNKIVSVDKPAAFAGVQGAEAIDAKGCLVVPGLIDLHVHLREPGLEWKETVETGTSAAVAGGFTAVCCMPNTRPVNDSASVTKYILKRAEIGGLCAVLPIGAITMSSEGKALSPMLELKEAGCVAFSDDGHSVHNAQIMRRALEYSSMLGGVLAVHEEDPHLAEGFCMHESALSLKMGLKGMPEAAENVMIARDIELARLTGGRVHFCHVSNARAVTLIKRAKEDGISVTAEAMPHHFCAEESAVAGYNTLAKMSMPLRSRADAEALIAGLQEGVIDCIASDHAPHEADSKTVEFEKASFGTLGLQTVVPLTLSQVRAGKVGLQRAIEALTVSPAKCFGLKPNSLAAGCVADFAVIDPEKQMKLSEAMIRSKSKNSMFLGWDLQGFAVKTFVGGVQVYDINELSV